MPSAASPVSASSLPLVFTGVGCTTADRHGRQLRIRIELFDRRIVPGLDIAQENLGERGLTAAQPSMVR
jgi:hypothetical protein